MKLINFAMLTIVASMSVHANAASIPSEETLIYISPSHYEHSVHLLHPYYDYWFKQGPIVEPIAIKALQDSGVSLSVCKSGQQANTVIRITPKIFYNPQMRVYHSELQATVYSGGGSKLGTYVGTAQQQGFNSVDHGLEGHLKQAYASAMQDLMGKINLSGDEMNHSEVKLPCNVVGAQIEPNINFY